MVPGISNGHVPMTSYDFIAKVKFLVQIYLEERKRLHWTDSVVVVINLLTPTVTIWANKISDKTLSTAVSVEWKESPVCRLPIWKEVVVA